MENINEIGIGESENTSEPVGTGANLFGPWMTVQEAVAYCVSKGLPRTAKTVRKWAKRSIESIEGGGEIIVKRQDTENGFRWLIGRESLDIKIEQEKEIAPQNVDENLSSDVSEPVGTGAHPSEQVATGAHLESNEIVSLLKKQLERAEHQLDVKDKQIDALLERDRETNVLIQGLQTSLTGVVNALPSGRHDERHQVNRFTPQPPEQGTPMSGA